MNREENLQDFLTTMQSAIGELRFNKLLTEEYGLPNDIKNLYSELCKFYQNLYDLVEESNFSNNYRNYFISDLYDLQEQLPYGSENGELEYINLSSILDDPSSLRDAIQHSRYMTNDELTITTALNNSGKDIREIFEKIKFTYAFFEKLNFLNGNLVAIGANGSGKTTLSNKLKEDLHSNGVIISAQKVLIIPTSDSIPNYEATSKTLSKRQLEDLTFRVTFEGDDSYSVLYDIGNEFKVLLDNLMADGNAIKTKYFDSLEDGEQNIIKPITNLDKAISIWNYLISHRTLYIDDCSRMQLRDEENDIIYDAYKMSDGEKVVLYLIAHALQAPKDGFIIVDEPEMYLHKTILKKLWDRLEQERTDCIFIYLTHDLDFATSRIAKKVWVKSFTYPDTWVIESIPDSDHLPEELLLELLGSRKNILFCEGEENKIDSSIYNILFPEFTIKPVGSCKAVIDFTKAFNKLPNTVTKAIGLIDKDHLEEERTDSLKEDKVYSFSMVEPENLLLDEEFLYLFAGSLSLDDPRTVVEKMKCEVLSKLQEQLELQVSNYISAKINYLFNNSHVKKGNSLIKVKENYSNFIKIIEIDAWYQERKGKLESIIEQKDYRELLGLFNNKGLISSAEKFLKISEFSDRAIVFLRNNEEAQKQLRKHFPEEIQKEGEMNGYVHKDRLTI